MPAANDLELMLREAALRVTQPRIAVLAAVHAHPHAETSAVIARVREQLGEVSTQAVYDVLAALHGAGLIRRIQPEGSVARYEARTGDNHHHVVCRTCGAIADVDCAVGHTPCLTASQDHGFLIDEAEVIYWGSCPACRAIESAATDAALAPGTPTHATALAVGTPDPSPLTPADPAAAPAPAAASAPQPSTSSEPTRGSHVYP